MVSNIKTLTDIFRSELKLIFQDPGSLLIMVGAIFLYGFFYMIPFSNHILRDVPIGVIDNDNSALSREVTRNLDANEFLKVVSKPDNLEQAKDEYYKNKIRAFVLIPKDFERDINRGANSFVSAYEDSSFLIVYKQVATGIGETIGQESAKIEIASLMKKGLSKQQSESVKMPFDFVQMPLYNPIGSYQNYIYPLVLIMILQQTMLIGVSMLGGTLKEKIQGVRQRNRNGKSVFYKVKRVNKYTDNPYIIVLGKSFAYVFLYFIYAMIYFFIFPAFVVYDMNINFFSMLLILLPFLFATAFLGQAMLYFCFKRESSLFVLIVSSVPLIFLPGFVWPKESIPFVLNVISHVIPVTSGIDGLVKINQMGASFSQVQKDFWILLILCAIYFLFAVQVVKNMQKDCLKNS